MTRRNGSIRLSEEHGVNPSVMVCPLCMQDTGVALLGKLSGDEEAPKHMLDDTPCDECKEHMSMGFLVIERSENMITGNRWVLKPDVITDEEMRAVGVAYVSPTEAKAMGLYNHPDFAEANDETSH